MVYLALLFEDPQVIVNVPCRFAAQVLPQFAIGGRPVVAIGQILDGFEDTRPHALSRTSHDSPFLCLEHLSHMVADMVGTVKRMRAFVTEQMR